MAQAFILEPWQLEEGSDYQRLPGACSFAVSEVQGFTLRKQAPVGRTL